MAVNDRGWVSQVPGYVGALISVGSLIFSVGVIYSDVNTLKQDVKGLYTDVSKQESILTRVNVLQLQVERSEQVQDKLAGKLDNIDKSLASISVGLARLEERLPEKVRENDWKEKNR